VPHDLLHVAQALNADVMQWVGHEPWSQSTVSTLCGHALPPLVGCEWVRVRLMLPAPHEALHAP
jgi:phosphohistidine phosphatase SixA